MLFLDVGENVALDVCGCGVELMVWYLEMTCWVEAIKVWEVPSPITLFVVVGSGKIPKVET